MIDTQRNKQSPQGKNATGRLSNSLIISYLSDKVPIEEHGVLEGELGHANEAMVVYPVCVTDFEQAIGGALCVIGISGGL